MIYNIDFIIAAIVLLTIILIYHSVRFGADRRHNRYFRASVIFALLCAILDAVSAVTFSYSLVSDTVNMILNTAYYISFFTFLFLLTVYVDTFFSLDGKRTFFGWINSIIVAAYYLLLIYNFYSGVVFDYDGGYIYGPLFMVTYYASAYYILFTEVVAFKNRARITKKLHRSIIFAGGIGATAMIVQHFFMGNTLFISFGLSICVLILMLSMEAPDYRKVLDEILQTLARTIDAKDAYTKDHSTRVAKYSKMIAKMLGMSPDRQQELYYVALLHDIGKIGISDDIINKRGELTDDEYEEIKQHTVIGGAILSRITLMPELLNGSKYHHERYDGSGYPEKLKGKDIPVYARIIGVADAYDAMSSRRSYRDVLPQSKVIAELVKGKGTQFDPVFAEKMLEIIKRDENYELREKSIIENYAKDVGTENVRANIKL